ncbi:hypothetical protein CK203_014017 [Vitis vinifera]|uniref:Uncharacterized protein n=1 Tax=Vitis vinifera TaxID=29760 RepID=A0A438JJD9_VITVI|nr:hypothetical protein CK203_014017 [Vitis vinifera]
MWRFHGGESQGGFLYHIFVDWECDGGVFGELDQLFGHKAHQCIDTAGAGECQSGGSSSSVGVDFPESGDGDGNDWLCCYNNGGGALQRGEEEIQSYNSLTMKIDSIHGCGSVFYFIHRFCF